METKYITSEDNDKCAAFFRHIQLRFAEPDAGGYTPLPIIGVMVGPTTHQQLCQIGVGDLLAAK